MKEKSNPLRACVAVLAVLPTPAALAQSAQIDSSYTDLSAYLLVGGKPLPKDVVIPSTATGGNFSAITQVGQNNLATVDVQGAGNSTSQFQVGAQNVSTVTVVGDANNLSTTQIGNHDNADLKVLGQGNTISQTQIGANLSYSLTEVGNGKTITVQQVGVK